MKRLAVRMGSALRATARVSISLAFVAGTAIPAFAGDRAAIDLVGYSSDQRYFAFEEFGIQDGSGFAYSNLYIVDLAEDRWVEGTPVRVRADGEDEGLAQIRAEARHEADAHLADAGIDTPAEFIALIGDGIPDTDARSLVFGAPGFSAPGAVEGRRKLALSSFTAPSVSPCEDWFGAPALGYELVLADVENAQSRVLHRDETLPKSRGCPQAYRLYGVALPAMAYSLDAAVVIVSVYPGGFEGPDRRFIAVPLGN